MNKNISTNIIKEYLEKYPDMKSNTLSKLIYKDKHKHFKNKEAVRSVIRYYKGRIGKANRDKLVDRRFKLPEPTKENPYSLPKEWNVAWKPFIIAGKKILVISDVHIPFHDTIAITACFNYLKNNNVELDTIVLNGDIWDCYALSRFNKDPEFRDFGSELQAIKHFLMALKNNFPNTKIIYKEGNHERRFQHHLLDKAPDFFGIEEFRIEVLLGLHELGITWIQNKRIIKIGKLNVLHGDETAGGGAGGVNPARGLHLKTQTTSMCGHFHRVSQHTSKTLNEHFIGCWSIGCLCYMNPDYMPINQWSHGFAIVTRENDNSFVVDNKRIINGKIV